MLDLSGKRVLVLGLGSLRPQRGALLRGARRERGRRGRARAEAIDGLERRCPSGRAAARRARSRSRGLRPRGAEPGRAARALRARARRAWGDVELAYPRARGPDRRDHRHQREDRRPSDSSRRCCAPRACARARRATSATPRSSWSAKPLDVAVLEVSSFQLEAVDAFRPRAAVLLNVTPDHLDRHGDIAGYLAAKARLFARQQREDVAIALRRLPGDERHCASRFRAPRVALLRARTGRARRLL